MVGERKCKYEIILHCIRVILEMYIDTMRLGKPCFTLLEG
jgi:hypothetical protein